MNTVVEYWVYNEWAWPDAETFTTDYLNSLKVYKSTTMSS